MSELHEELIAKKPPSCQSGRDSQTMCCFTASPLTEIHLHQGQSKHPGNLKGCAWAVHFSFSMPATPRVPFSAYCFEDWSPILDLLVHCRQFCILDAAGTELSVLKKMPDWRIAVEHVSTVPSIRKRSFLEEVILETKLAMFINLEDLSSLPSFILQSGSCPCTKACSLAMNLRSALSSNLLFPLRFGHDAEVSFEGDLAVCLHAILSIFLAWQSADSCLWALLAPHRALPCQPQPISFQVKGCHLPAKLVNPM